MLFSLGSGRSARSECKKIVYCPSFPGFRLHPLKGALKGHFAVSVTGNWRVTFRFEDGHAVEIDYLDYH